MIKFEDIHIIGFGSVRDLHHTFNDAGITVIQGPNGSGKTSIFSALFWVLYGEKIKEKSTVNTWEHKQPKGYAGTYVKVTWYQGDELHTVIRCENYKHKVFGAKGNNRLVYDKSKNSHKREVQKDIEEALGMSSRLFKNSILFGQKMKRVIEDTGAEKKKTFEQCFNMSFIDRANNIAKEEIKTNLELKEPLEDKIDEIQDKIDEKNRTIKEAMGKHRSAMDLYKTKKEGLEEIIELKRDKLLTLDTYKEEYEKSTKELEKLKSTDRDISQERILTISDKIGGNEVNIAFSNNDIQRLEAEISEGGKNRVCNGCKRPLEKMKLSEKKEKLKKIKELQSKIEKLNKESAELRAELKDIQSIKTKINNLERVIRKKPEDSTELEAEIKKKEDELSKLEKPIKPNLESVEKSLIKLKMEYNEVSNKISKLNIRINKYQWLLKGPLSNNGLKAYLFRLLLDNLNDVVYQYKSILGYRVEFEVDLESHNKDILTTVFDEDGVPVFYEDLSGGQQQLINVATAFAIHDVVMKYQPFNILILDEVFEGLDRDNIHKVTELLQLKSVHNGIYVITHHEAFNPQNARIINLTLDQGLTRILA